MGIKVYKSGYQVIIDDSSKDDKIYKTAYFTRFGFNGNNVWIKDLDFGELIFLGDVSEMEDSVGTIIGGKDFVEEYLLSFIGSDDGDSPVASEILFLDTFNGAVLNPDSKWTVTNTNPTKVVFTQNDELIGTTDASGGTSGYMEDYFLSDGFALDPTKELVFVFDVENSELKVNSAFYIGMTGDATPLVGQDIMTMQAGNDAVTFSLSAKIGGVSIGTGGYTVPTYVGTMRTYKLRITPTAMITYYWNGVAWVLIDTYSNAITGTWKIFTASRALANTSIINNDNFYLTEVDFPTQYPV